MDGEWDQHNLSLRDGTSHSGRAFPCWCCSMETSHEPVPMLCHPWQMPASCHGQPSVHHQPGDAQQPGLPRPGQASARWVCPDRLHSHLPSTAEATRVGGRHRDVAQGCSMEPACRWGQPVVNPSTSFLIARGAHPGHRASGSAVTTEATRLPSRANTPQTPVLGRLAGYPRPHRRHLGEKARTSGALCPRLTREGRWMLCVWGN